MRGKINTRGRSALSIILLVGSSLFYLIGSGIESSLIKGIVIIMNDSFLVGFSFGKTSEEGIGTGSK